MVMETAMEFAKGEGAKMNVADLLETANVQSADGMGTGGVPWCSIHDKSVFVLLSAGKQLADVQNRAKPGCWHVFVELTECRPMYISTSALFGKQAGPGDEFERSMWGEHDLRIACARC